MEVETKHVVKGQDALVPAHLNFGKYMLDKIKLNGDNIALQNATTGETLSYKELAQRAVETSTSLIKLGVAKTDIVVVCVDDRIAYTPIALGVIFTGATICAHPSDIGRAVLKHRLSIIQPKYLICGEQVWKKYSDVLKTVNFTKIISVDNIFKASAPVTLLPVENCNVETFEVVDVQGQTDIALICYSSGTSGMPKAIELTHLNCFLHMWPYENISFNTCFHNASWGHKYHDMRTFMFLARGNKIVYVNGLSVETWLDAVDQYQVDFLLILPMKLNQLTNLKDITKFDLKSLKIIYCSTAALHSNVVQKAKSIFPCAKVMPAYGLTECGALCTTMCGVKGYKPGSVGMPAPGVILKVVDLQSEKSLRHNENGEIRAKSPGLMKGYIAVDSSSYLDEEGFYKTGDIGYYDEDGYFYIIGRLAEFIKCDGCKVSPLEMERILQQHPGVYEVAVVGAPNPVHGEVPTAFVVKKSGANVTEQELIDLVAAEVTHFMKLRGGVRFVSELPRNAQGKVIRRELTEMLLKNVASM